MGEEQATYAWRWLMCRCECVHVNRRRTASPGWSGCGEIRCATLPLTADSTPTFHLLHTDNLNDVALIFLSLPSPYLPFENRRGWSWRSAASSRPWRPLPGTAPRRGPSPRTPACRGKARRRRSRAGGGRAIHPCGRMPRRQGRGRGVVCRRRRAKPLDRSPESPSCPRHMPGEWLYVVARSEGRGQKEGQGGVGREMWVVGG